MQLSEIKEAPTHHPNVPPHLMKGISDEDRYVVETLSVMQQDFEWVKGIALTAYNAAARGENEKFKNQRWMVKMVAGGLMGGVMTELAHHFIK